MVAPGTALRAIETLREGIKTRQLNPGSLLPIHFAAEEAEALLALCEGAVMTQVQKLLRG